MGLRIIFTTELVSERQVKVYRDSEWQEFRARLFIAGVPQHDADYHDSDKESCISTAKFMLNRELGLNPKLIPISIPA
jgi:hypothetical protein